MLRSWESPDKSIKKDVLKQGEFSKKPRERSTCNVTVEDINITGASAEDLRRKCHTEILDGEGEKMLILGDASAEIDRKIERVLQMMNVYEKNLITLVLPVKQQDDTGDNKLVTVRFKITLNKCERHEPIWEWSTEEKYRVASRYKKRGVELFKDSRIVDAFHKFSRACKILITLEPISDLKLEKQLESDIEDLRLALYNNMAMCQLSRKNYEHVVSLCTKVLDRDQNNVKALYRRGMAHGNMRDNEKAVTDLKIALTLEPGNCTVKEQFNIYNSRLQESVHKRNDMVKRMFKV